VFHPGTDDLRLYHRDEGGRVIGQFPALRRTLAARGLQLVAAMNGAMYHANLDVVGYYVEAGEELAPLVTAEGPGNFGLLPNGVFCLGDGEAHVVETRAFAAAPRACAYAMQSGPLLVQGGALHPRLLPDSDSRFVRNGVGVRADGAIVWAITSERVNFHRFARLMRDGLSTPDALYVDGKVSRLYAPELGRSDPGFPVGPIMAVVAPL
jgi:uncharacterized protein YigE (DUF2233 family)